MAKRRIKLAELESIARAALRNGGVFVTQVVIAPTVTQRSDANWALLHINGEPASRSKVDELIRRYRLFTIWPGDHSLSAVFRPRPWPPTKFSTTPVRIYARNSRRRRFAQTHPACDVQAELNIVSLQAPPTVTKFGDCFSGGNFARHGR
jgi:hypothetical protein